MLWICYSVHHRASSRMDQQYYTRQEADRMIASLLVAAAACLLDVYWRRPKRLQRPPVPPRPPPASTQISKRIWCREWLMRRSIHGDYHQLLEELNKEDKMGFKNFVRIQPELFSEMVERISPRLTKNVLVIR